AFDAERVVAAVDAMSDREKNAVGELLDPEPWWVLSRSERARHAMSPARAMRLLRGAAAATARLREAPLIAEVTIATPAPAPLFDVTFVRDAFEPCVAAEP